MRNIIKVSIFIMTVCFSGSTIYGQGHEHNSLKGPYKGLKLPGKTPVKFGGDRYYRFFNNGTECIYPDKGLWYSKLKNGKWTKPVNTNINYGKYADFEMNISPDGEKILFNSINRPLPEGAKKTNSQIWISRRKGDKWEKPVNPGFGGMYVTSTTDGTIYYTNVDDKEKGYIAKSRMKNGKYLKEEIIPEPVFSESISDAHPCIAPDESYLIFDSSDRERINNCQLYICFRNSDGSWTEPVNMGNYIKQASAAMAKVTLDGKVIFYHDNKGIVWWVSAKIIHDIKHSLN